MKIAYQAQNLVSAQAVRSATGKSWDEWFALLDKFDAQTKGRKATNEFLYHKNKVDAWWTTTIAVEYERARKIVEKDGNPKGYNICVTKGIKATAQQVFDAFSKPAVLSKWFGAGSKVDFREGGGFSNADGNRGQFKRINPGKGLRFTWEGERHAPVEVVEVKLQASGSKCSVVLTHDRMQSREVADGMRTAWGAAFDALKAQLEG